MRPPNLKNDQARQNDLMRWVAKGLDLAERAGAAYALTDADFESSAADNAALLVRIAVLIARRSPDLHALERSVCFADGDPAAAIGVPLGRYLAGAAPRTVVLAPASTFDEPPRAADPHVADAVFADGISPSPVLDLTRGRFGAIHLGLCRLLERAACDIMSSFRFGAPASTHPLLERARAAVCHARQHGGASDVDLTVQY
jgi:hypothetical protein